MNWINTSENLIITIVSFTVGVILGAFISIQVSKSIINSNQEILIEAIHKETTAINNDYDIKNKKGTLDLKPKNFIMNQDSLDKINKKHGWLIFGKHKK